MLTELLDKAQTELDDARFAVTNAAHNFATLKQSIEDQMAQAKTALEKDKAVKSELATALVVEKADPAEAQESLASLKTSQASSKSTCGQVASDYELSVKGFAEESEALADATQEIQGEIGGAKEPTYSLVQEKVRIGLKTTTDLRGVLDVLVVMQRQVPQVQFMDKVVGIPGVAQGQTPMVQMSQITIEIPQVKHVDKVVWRF